MKRLLLVTHVFPPAPSPGALRPGYLSRYLPQFGWDVTVLTASTGTPPFPARVVSTSSSNSFEERLRAKIGTQKGHVNSPLRRLLRTVKENVLFPDTTAPWMRPALQAAAQVLKSEKFDAILSTAHPPSVHVIAWVLARQTGLPWIADYRDPWAGNLYLKRPLVRQLLEEWLERGIVRRASALSTISEPIAAQLRRFHRRRDVYVIPNAYDPSDWTSIPPATPSRFDLCYTGSMYGGKRSADPLFAAIARLRAANDCAGTDACVHFYGPNSENIEDRAAHYGLNLVVRQHGTVPRSQAMRAQRNAGVLLIFLNMDPATSDEMGSKYLEYLGARRPILVIGPPNSVMRSFIESRRLGWFASTAAEARLALKLAHERFARGDFDLNFDGDDVPAARDMAFRFSELLDRTIGFDNRLEQPIFMQGA